MQLDRGSSRPGAAAGSAVTRRITRRAGSVATPRRVSSAGSYGSRSSGGGGSVRNYGYSSTPRISTTSSGRYSAPAPPPSAKAGGGGIPGINAYLTGDTGYQQQLRQFAKALSDFGADVGRRRGSLTSEYGLSTKAMKDQKVQDLQGLQEDYGSRGLLRSGLYADAVGDYSSEFDKRMADLSRRQTDAVNQLNQESSQFRSAQGLQKQSARESAIRRRAEKYGV